MNVESGFFAKGGMPSSIKHSESLTGANEVYASGTGFFRILIGKHLGKKVIIKTVKDEYADNPVAVSQLRKEFSVIFPLDSPHIAQAYSWIDTVGRAPAIEMEWCDGKNLRESLSDGLSSEEIIEIIQGVIDGLGDIHKAGVVHRDIKPENVMYDPFRKVVKIIDFGCAYLTGALSLQGPNGTTGYTPEDKMEGDVESEPKDDLYALGIMVGELADAMRPATRNDRRLRKRLRRFAQRLTAGEFLKADKAGEELERVIRGGIDIRLPLVIGISVALIAILMGILVWLFPDQRSSLSTMSMEPGSANSAAGSNVSGIEVDEAHKAHKDGDLIIGTQHESPRKTPEDATAGVSEETSAEAEEDVDRKALFRLAFAAGPLLVEAQSPDASLQTRMDAFVIKYCDSIYMSTGMNAKYPHYMEAGEMSAAAKQLTGEYIESMEREFYKRFGNHEGRWRRELLLEGRFHAQFRAYHNNPYYKKN